MISTCSPIMMIVMIMIMMMVMMTTTVKMTMMMMSRAKEPRSQVSWVRQQHIMISSPSRSRWWSWLRWSQLSCRSWRSWWWWVKQCRSDERFAETVRSLSLSVAHLIMMMVTMVMMITMIMMIIIMSKAKQIRSEFCWVGQQQPIMISIPSWLWSLSW